MVNINHNDKSAKTGLFSIYLRRAGIGFVVGMIAEILCDLVGINRNILSAAFFFWVWFMSEPSITSTLKGALGNDMKRYAHHQFGLKITLVLAYFVAKLGLYAVFVYFQIVQ